jgi:hypothetical protein
MAVPTSYLTTTKNLGKILASIQNAQAPKQFTTRFLASLGFASAADRLIIGVLKSLGFANVFARAAEHIVMRLTIDRGKLSRIAGKPGHDLPSATAPFCQRRTGSAFASAFSSAMRTSRSWAVR